MIGLVLRKCANLDEEVGAGSRAAYLRLFGLWFWASVAREHVALACPSSSARQCLYSPLGHLGGGTRRRPRAGVPPRGEDGGVWAGVCAVSGPPGSGPAISVVKIDRRAERSRRSGEIKAAAVVCGAADARFARRGTTHPTGPHRGEPPAPVVVGGGAATPGGGRPSGGPDGRRFGGHWTWMATPVPPWPRLWFSGGGGETSLLG